MTPAGREDSHTDSETWFTPFETGKGRETKEVICEKNKASYKCKGNHLSTLFHRYLHRLGTYYYRKSPQNSEN